jgi:lipopolysaccharide export system protein LptC
MRHQLSASSALTYSILIIILMGSIWLLKKTTPPDVISTDSTTSTELADYFLKQFKTVETHLDNEQQYQFSGTHLIHFPHSAHSKISDIRVQMSGKNQNQLNIWADNGQLTDNGQRLDLQKNIRLVSYDPNPQKTVTITSQSLTIYPQQEYAHTDSPVHIQSENFSIQATGMTSWWNTQKLQLHSHVKTTYTRTTP